MSSYSPAFSRDLDPGILSDIFRTSSLLPSSGIFGITVQPPAQSTSSFRNIVLWEKDFCCSAQESIHTELHVEGSRQAEERSNRMKQLHVVLLIFFLFILPLTAQEKNTSLTLYAGYPLPMGGSESIGTSGTSKFTEGWNGTIDLGAGIGFGLSRQLQIMVEVDYASFSLNANEFLDGRVGTVSGGVMSALNISVALQLCLSDNIESAAPFVKIGLGALGFSDLDINASGPGFTENIQVTRTAFIQDASFIFGAGISIQMNSKTDLIVEGRYILGLSDTKNYLPIHGGIRFRL